MLKRAIVCPLHQAILLKLLLDLRHNRCFLYSNSSRKVILNGYDEVGLRILHIRKKKLEKKKFNLIEVHRKGIEIHRIESNIIENNRIFDAVSFDAISMHFDAITATLRIDECLEIHHRNESKHRGRRNTIEKSSK